MDVIMAKALFYLLSSFCSVAVIHLCFSRLKPVLRCSSTENVEQLMKQDSPEDIRVSWSPSMYTEEAQADMIRNLPGLQFEPKFNQFSGYITVSDGPLPRKIHYWYIESQNNPRTDPVMFWTNGGPGCSGLLGLGTEFGPYLFEADGGLSANPFTWNQYASILYVEQPAGVGFSTIDPKDKFVNDKRATIDNYELIAKFFNRYPERKSNELYIASESYGGHYIPHLAMEILDRNDGSINFKGFLVGNPYVDPFSNDVTMMQTYYMHGLFAKPLYSVWQENCVDPSNYDIDKCDTLVDKLMEEVGDGINPYALDFPVCMEDNPDYPPETEKSERIRSSSVTATGVATRRRMTTSTSSSQSIQLMKQRSRSSLPPFLSKSDAYHPCAEAHLYNYLNRDDVKKALHVDQNIKWSTCADDIDYSEDDINTPQMHLYEKLIKKAKESSVGLKMMIFTGDDDSVCSTAGTQYWIYNLGVPYKKDRLWKPWKYENQTAGYLTEFDLGNLDSSFIFATVHGAGHEVPSYRPAEALAMLKSYFDGEWDT